MYRITTPAGEALTTETPYYIRKHTNGSFVPCAREEAEGVAHGGTPYLFADGTMLREIDGGKMLGEQDTAVKSLILSLLEV